MINEQEQFCTELKRLLAGTGLVSGSPPPVETARLLAQLIAENQQKQKRKTQAGILRWAAEHCHASGEGLRIAANRIENGELTV